MTPQTRSLKAQPGTVHEGMPLPDLDWRALARTVLVSRAIDRIEEIASVKGVDGVFVGPSDLAASMGHLGNYNHPDVQAKIAEAAKRILATGKAAATLSFNADQARAYAGMGYHMIAAASDATLLRQGAAALVDGFKSFR